jgi:RNA polymerase sigma-70 factor (ECF subfamily)
MGVAPSDEQLVQRMAAGDERALAELHRRYAPHLAALARRMLGDPDEADASVQAAFISAWDTATHFDPHKLSAKTWLVTVTHRLVMRRVRERETKPLALKDRGVSPRPVGHTGEADANPPGGTVTAEARDLLERAFFQGCTLQDLADLTGRPLEDVKQELRAALERLSGALGERES